MAIGLVTHFNLHHMVMVLEELDTPMVMVRTVEAEHTTEVKHLDLLVVQLA